MLLFLLFSMIDEVIQPQSSSKEIFIFISKAIWTTESDKFNIFYSFALEIKCAAITSMKRI